MTTKRIMPIHFKRLFPGSTYTIFAEPSRGIRKSNDPTVYKKVCDAWSEDTTNPEKCIILMPDDLVTPLTRGTAV